MLKLDEKGNLEWQKTFGGQLLEAAHAVQETSDRGYLVAGSSTSFGIIPGNYSYLVLKVDSNGDIPACPFMEISNSTVMDIKASGEDVNLPGVDTNVVPETVHIDPTEFDVAEAGVCPFTVSPPTTPSGPTIGKVGRSYTFTTGGSISSPDNPVEYQFDWKGDASDLSNWGSMTQSYTWPTAGVYNVRARVRAALNVSVMSEWSNPLTVGISIPKVSVIPSSYDFGNVKAKRSKTISLKVKNIGTADLLISTSIIGTHAAMFSIRGGSGNKTLKPGRTLSIRVAFKPTSQGPKTSTLKIISNDPATPAMDIVLSGTGL